MEPCNKTKFDKERLLEAVLDDTIDIIATDHAPHSLEEKNNFILKLHQVDHLFNILSI